MLSFLASMFSSRTMILRHKTWREALESFRVMRSLLIKVILILFDGLTKENCIAAYLFWRSCDRIRRKSGPLFLALYLKQCRICLQKYVAEDKYPEHSVAISTTRSGIPRIIPSFHRKKVKDRNPAIIQLYMSFFTVSKLIQLASKISKSTFESIVDLPQSDKIQGVIENIFPSIEGLLNRYIPGLDKIPLKQGISFKPTWKSTPVLSWYRARIRKIAQTKGD